MKFIWPLSNGARVEFEVATAGEAFDLICRLQESIELEPCGQCGKTDVYFHKRKAEGKDPQTGKQKVFFPKSMRCAPCGAMLDIGEGEQGIYKNRHWSDGKAHGKNGWYHWGDWPGKSQSRDNEYSQPDTQQQPAEAEEVMF